MEYGDRSSCLNRNHTYVEGEKAEPCKQQWVVTMEPEYFSCGIDTVLNLSYTFDCDPAFVKERGECPFTRHDNVVSFEFDYETDNWCDVLDIDLEPPQAYMDSYLTEQCSSLSDDFKQKERPHYEVHVEGNGYLTITDSKLIGLQIYTSCGATYQNEAWFMLDGSRTSFANEINLYVDNKPSLVCEGSAAETVRFSFDLDSKFFAPPKKSHCEFEIWAFVELEYVGFTRETKLLSVELNQAGTNFGEADPNNVGSIKKMGSYEAAGFEIEATPAPEATSGASSLAVSMAALAMAAVPAFM